MYRDAASTCSLCGAFVQPHEADIVPDGLRCRRCTLKAIGTEGTPASAFDHVESAVLTAVGGLFDGRFAIGEIETAEESRERQLRERIAVLESDNENLRARVKELSARLLLETGKPG